MIIIHQKNLIGLTFCEIANNQQYCLSIEVFGQKCFDIYSFYRLSRSHPWECTTSCQSQLTWSVIINIDWYETQLSRQVFQLYCPGPVGYYQNQTWFTFSIVHQNALHWNYTQTMCEQVRPNWGSIWGWASMVHLQTHRNKSWFKWKKKE